MALPVKTSAFLRETGDIADFTGRFFTQVFKPRYEIAGFVRQCFLIGYKSLPLIGLTGFIMALVLTMQLRPLPVEYGVELQLPAMVGIAIVRLRDAFSENMEALKHNFLFHGYFKKQGCKKHKENKQGIAAQKSM